MSGGVVVAISTIVVDDGDSRVVHHKWVLFGVFSLVSFIVEPGTVVGGAVGVVSVVAGRSVSSIVISVVWLKTQAWRCGSNHVVASHVCFVVRCVGVSREWDSIHVHVVTSDGVVSMSIATLSVAITVRIVSIAVWVSIAVAVAPVVFLSVVVHTVSLDLLFDVE